MPVVEDEDAGLNQTHIELNLKRSSRRASQSCIES